MPPAEDVRTALRHFAELGAAAQGRGISGPEGSADRKSDADTLTKVTELLLKHRANQRRHQRDAIYGILLRALADVYAAVRDAGEMTPHEIQERVVEAFALHGIELAAEELDELVIEWDVPPRNLAPSSKASPRGPATPALDELTIKSCGGPQEAAKKTLARVLGRATGTLANAKREADSLPLARYAFGRWVASGVREQYLREVGLRLPRVKHPLAGSLRSLIDLDEEKGAAFDLAVEHWSHEIFTTEWGIQMAFCGEPKSEGMRHLRAQLIDRWQLSYPLIIMTIMAAPDKIEEILERAEPSERLRFATREAMVALHSPDASAADDALKNLSVAVFADLLDEARARLSEHFADLTPKPSQEP